VSGALGTRLFRLWHADSVKYWQFLPTFLRNNRHSIPKKCKILQLRGEAVQLNPGLSIKADVACALPRKWRSSVAESAHLPVVSFLNPPACPRPVQGQQIISDRIIDELVTKSLVPGRRL
jgi:hypothetical protein